MAIGSDFLIDYVNKRIYNVGTTVYTVRALYTYLMDAFDAQGAMDDDVPMSAQTPNAYTMINGWFIDDNSTHYLEEGAITTSGYTTVIAVITCQASGYVACEAADVTKPVEDDDAAIGALLAYNNTTRKWWVRTTSTVANGSKMEITGGAGGLGGTTLSSAFDNSGEDLYVNVYTLGTIESGSDIYIYQAGSKITSWWSSGHIDVLIKTMEMGSEIDNGNVTVYGRVYTDLYDYFEIDLSAGGRNAVPLATSDDLDNQTAVATILDYMDSILVMFVNGTIPYSGAAGDSPIANKVIHGQTSHATAYILNTSSPFTLASIEGTFQNAEVIEICEVIKFDARVSTKFFAPGDTIENSGDTATAIVRKVVQDPQDSGLEGILFVTNVTGTWADNDLIQVSNVTFATQNGAISTNTFTANTTATVTFADTIDKDLNNPSGPQPYNVVIDLGGLSVATLYQFVKAFTRRTSTLQTYPTNGTTTVYAYNGEFYQKADTTYTQLKKASPFGTFAGGKFFGARGVFIQNMVGTDSENYSLIDALNATENPPTSATIRVVSMIPSTDRVLVCESTGEGLSVIKKNQYTMTVQSNQSYIEVSGAIADDAPATGVVRVVVNYGTSTESEDIYNYTSIDRSGADDKFILAAPTGQSYDTDDRAYNPYIDTTSDSSGNREVILKYSLATKYIVARVRQKGYIPYQLATSFVSGLTTITAIRTVDGIVE